MILVVGWLMPCIVIVLVVVMFSVNVVHRQELCYMRLCCLYDVRLVSVMLGVMPRMLVSAVLKLVTILGSLWVQDEDTGVILVWESTSFVMLEDVRFSCVSDVLFASLILIMPDQLIMAHWQSTKTALVMRSLVVFGAAWREGAVVVMKVIMMH